jgi:flagellar basal body rod protein FlgG
MNNALFTAAAGMRDNAQKMETIVHNLANGATTAFKRHIAMSVPFTQFLDETLEGMEGTGMEDFITQKIRFDCTNGSLKFTKRPLDVALQDVSPAQQFAGDPASIRNENFNRSRGGYAMFAVQVAPRLVTRPRAYNINEDRVLVEATGADGRGFGQPAINSSGDEIVIPEGARDAHVDKNGFVIVDDQLFAQIPDNEVVAELDPGIQYTRNGNFHLNTENVLVTVEGFPVLDQNNGIIQLDDDVTTQNIEISDLGGIRANGEDTGHIIGVFRMKDVPVPIDLTFQLNEANFISNARGRPIVDINGRNIYVPEGGDWNINAGGEVFVDGDKVTVTIEQPGQLDRGEDEPMIAKTRFGYYVPADEFVKVEGAPDDYSLQQCYLEQSNVNVISELGQMIITMRTFEADARLLQSMERNLQLVTNSRS